MKTKFLFIPLLLLFASQSYGQLIVGDTFDGANNLTYTVESLSPLEASVKGFTVTLVANTDITIPSSVTVGAQTFLIVGIGTTAFNSTSNAKTFLKNIVFPPTLRFIKASAFQGGRLLTFTLTNPSALTTLEGSIFAGNIALLSADLSNIKADLSGAASMFNNCTAMTSFTMRNNTVTTTLPSTFLGTCSSMSVADFSGCTNITALSTNVFRNNKALTTLYLGSDTPPTLSFTSNAQTFALINGGGLTSADRTLYLPTNTGVSNFSAVSAWTDLFGDFQSQVLPVVGAIFDFGILSYKIDNLSPNIVSVVGFSSDTVSNLVIPSTVTYLEKTYTVTGVNASAFKQKSGLISVEFPSTLTFIGNTAFQEIITLESFNITNPSALTTLGQAIFEGCTELQIADLSGISASLSTSDSMFNNCTSLSTFIMNNNTQVTTVPATFLGSCLAMTTADFSGCTNLTAFSDNVFRSNASLIILYLGSETPPSLSATPNNQTFALIGDGGLTNLNRTLYLPTNTSVTNFSTISTWTDVFGNLQMKPQPGETFSMGPLTYKIENISPTQVSVTGFSGATIADLVIPSSVNYTGKEYAVIGIGESAFKQKSGLVSVEFPSTLTYIGDTAFQQTTTLESFIITNPSVITSLGRAIFDGCTGLLTADFSNISANLVTSNSMFNNCTALTSFTMTNNTAATTIPASFLGACSALTVAVFTGCTNITTFSDNVFRNNTSLTTLYLGTNTPPSLSNTADAQTFAYVDNGSLTKADRTLYTPTGAGISSYSAISEWTDVFGTIKIKLIQNQLTPRPLIWVKNSEKLGILESISNTPWKSTYYTAFKNRVDKELANYNADRQVFLNKLPFNRTNAVAGQIPPFKIVNDGFPNAAEDRITYKINLQSAVDSGVMYFLTGNQDYARYSASIFYTYLKAMLQVPLSTSGNFNASWIYSDDHLRESRDFGAQLPIIYDFIATFINEGGTAYDFAAGTEVTINRLEAETIFKNYVFLAKNRGGLISNWPILESSSLVGNILALDSEAERAAEIPYYINKNTARQASLDRVSKTYKDNGGTWPEPFTYSRYVGEYTTYLMNVMTKYDPSLNLLDKYSNIPLSLDISNDFVYPNKNRIPQFGDTSRSFAKYREGYEMAYHLGKLSNNQVLIDKFGVLINSSVALDGYNRAALSASRSVAVEPYFEEPVRLLWYEPIVEGASEDVKLNTTNSLAFAGLSLQRNIDVPDPLNNGLMLFVGGAGFVHSYASGMNMELYGPKTVLGAAAGNTKSYSSEIHKNYYRLFASHNTVIVNGSSQGLSGNVNININTVQKVAIEPEYQQVPVSPKNSFFTTSFADDRGTLAEAIQNRIMAIVRTSPTSGYYVDVFKSDSSLPNEYHDYVYHNLADNLQLKNSANTDISLTDAPSRYPVMNTNGGFKNPGWHVFTDIKTSGVITSDVNATFTATRLGGGSVNMKMHIPGEGNREYTRVQAPPTLGLSSSYETTPTPTILIRKTGEAWDAPFAVIYEPYLGENANTVTSVQSIKRNGVFTGMQVESVVNEKTIKQIILIKDNDNDVLNDAALGVQFTGRFAVLSMDENDKLTSIYMGKGSYINYKGWDIKSTNNLATGFYVEITDQNAQITTNAALTYSAPAGTNVTLTGVNSGETLSLENNEMSRFQEGFVMYPNPVNSLHSLKLRIQSSEINNASFKIVNILGKVMIQQKISGSEAEVDISKLSQGIYLVQMMNNNKVIGNKKLIVK